MKRIIGIIAIVALSSTSLYAAGWGSALGGFSDGVNQGIQNAYQIQQMRLMEEQRQTMEQQRLMMEQEQRRLLEQQRLTGEKEQRRAEQEIFLGKVRRAHPDFEKYLADGSLMAWIQKQPDGLRDLLMKVYNGGDAGSSIALLTQFKRENNIQ